MGLVECQGAGGGTTYGLTIGKPQVADAGQRVGAIRITQVVGRCQGLALGGGAADGDSPRRCVIGIGDGDVQALAVDAAQPVTDLHHDVVAVVDTAVSGGFKVGGVDEGECATAGVDAEQAGIRATGELIAQVTAGFTGKGGDGGDAQSIFSDADGSAGSCTIAGDAGFEVGDADSERLHIGATLAITRSDIDDIGVVGVTVRGSFKVGCGYKSQCTGRCVDVEPGLVGAASEAKGRCLTDIGIGRRHGCDCRGVLGYVDAGGSACAIAGDNGYLIGHQRQHHVVASTANVADAEHIAAHLHHGALGLAGKGAGDGIRAVVGNQRYGVAYRWCIPVCQVQGQRCIAQTHRARKVHDGTGVAGKCEAHRIVGTQRQVIQQIHLSGAGVGDLNVVVGI